MSKVKRFNFGYKPASRIEPGRYGPVEEPDGIFVYHSDYSALERHVAELESVISNLPQIKDMQPLGAEFEKVWNDNTDKLYEN